MALSSPVFSANRRTTGSTFATLESLAMIQRYVYMNVIYTAYRRISFTDNARTICKAGSMERHSVRLSAPGVPCPSRGPQPKMRCRFAAVGPAGRRYRSIAAAAAGESGQCHVVSVRSSRTQTCFSSILWQSSRAYRVRRTAAVVVRRRRSTRSCRSSERIVAPTTCSS